MKISELPNAPRWLIDAATENADVEWGSGPDSWIVWRGGEWRGGVWCGGVWLGGVWRDGEWRGGVWRGGAWLGGVWRGGEWRGLGFILEAGPDEEQGVMDAFEYMMMCAEEALK